MTLQAHPIRKIFSRFFPRKFLSAGQEIQEWNVLTEEQKKELAIHKLAQGELALLHGNLSALSLFEAASQLEPLNPVIWYRQGLAFFEYGSEEGKEKALLLASKHFKYAVLLDPQFFEAWTAWGNTLLQLGKFHAEHHFHLEARDKYQKALELSTTQPKEALAELYWDYGIVWAEIAKHSGEALDVRLSIEALQTSLQYQDKPSPEFLHDCGKAHLEIGLLVNDARLLPQAAHYLLQSVEIAPAYFDGWSTLAEVYSQLYMNTLDERYIGKASQAFQQAVRLSNHNAEIWLSWAQILAESGRINQDAKLLRQSIENCARAFTLDPKDPLIVAQWVESLSWLGQATSRLDLLIEAEQKILKATDAYPDDPDLWHAFGVCLACFGRYYEDADFYEMAIEKLQYGLSIDRTAAEHWHTLALIHTFYAEETHHEEVVERANRFFAFALDLKPSCPALQFDAACSLLHESELTGNLPLLQKALTHFESLLQQHEDVLIQHPKWLVKYAHALAWLSAFSMEEKQLSHALDVFLHVLLIDPDFRGIHHDIANCYAELGHRTGEAEYYKKGIAFFRLAARQDGESDQVWLDWGTALIHLAQCTQDRLIAHQLYLDAEQKILKGGSLGHPAAHYTLACLYSIQGRTNEAMELIRTALSAKELPPIEELFEDEWLDNLRATESFAQFLGQLEAKLQAREQ